MTSDQGQTRRPARRRTAPGKATTARRTGPAAPAKAGKRAAPAKAGKRAAPAKAGKRAAPAKAGKRAAPAKAGKRAAPAEAGAATRPAGTGDGQPMIRWSSVTVPVPVGVRPPHLHMPHLGVPAPAKTAAQQTAHAVETVRTTMPPRRLAYFGALGVAAAIGAIEWPVAAAIGAGVWVASKARRTDRKPGPEAAAGRAH